MYQHLFHFSVFACTLSTYKMKTTKILNKKKRKHTRKKGSKIQNNREKEQKKEKHSSATTKANTEKYQKN